MDAKELKEKIDSVVISYNEKTNNNTEYKVIQVMNEINDMIEENGAFYKLNGAEKPLIYDLFYLNSVLKWNKSTKHKLSLINTYFEEEIYKVSMNQNIFNFLPKTKLSSVNKVKIKSYTSSDKSFRDLVSDFCGDDGLRPNMQMTNFNSLGIVSTDAHKLLFISKKDDNQKEENVCISDFCLKQQEKFPLSYENTKYPNWKAVIPQKHVVPFEFIVDTESLRKYLEICLNIGFFVKKTDELHVSFKLKDKDSSEHSNVGFNLIYLKECLEAFIKLGIEKTKIHFGQSNRAIILTDANNNEIDFLNQNFILLMLVVVNDDSMLFHFDFETNSVVYGDKKYEFPIPIEENYSKEAFNYKQEEVTINITLEELSQFPAIKEEFNKLTDNKLIKEVKGGCSTNYNIGTRTYNCEYYLLHSNYTTNPEEKTSKTTFYKIHILKGVFGEGENSMREAEQKVLKYFGRIKEEPKNIENSDDYDFRLDDNMSTLIESKINESNIAENKKEKIKTFIYTILNKNKDFIVNGKNEIERVIAWFSDLTSNPTSTKILFEILGEKVPKTHKAVDEFLRNYIGLGSKQKDWLTKKEAIEIINNNLGKFVFLSNSKRDWQNGYKTYPKDPKDLMYLIEIDNNDVLYKYENNPSTYQVNIDNVRDVVIDGKSSINDNKLEEIVKPLFKKEFIAPDEEKLTLTKEEVEEKLKLSPKEKREWFDTLNLKNYDFAIKVMREIGRKPQKTSDKSTENKSDLENLQDILALSEGLLELVSETGSKEEIDFLETKIELTKGLISLL